MHAVRGGGKNVEQCFHLVLLTCTTQTAWLAMPVNASEVNSYEVSFHCFFDDFCTSGNMKF